MKERTRKIFIMIVMAALIVSLTAASFAALTYGRYTGGKLDEDSPYDDLIDFVGATAFEVSSPDAFINAINNGYSYIKIADDAEEPFVINNNVADVYTNLVLDVNGHVVVRNSRNPLLDVRRSISVVLVYDSSTDADGGFYNPVGSSLQTSGGTLTVGEGVYESGPNVEAVQSVTTAEISDVFVRDGGRASATKFQKANAAAQLPKPGKDVYLDETYSGTKNDCLKADTYLLYTVEKNAFVGKVGDTVDGTELKNGQLYVNAKKDVNGTVTSAEEFSPICNVASCDFYYYYPVSGTAGTAGSLQTYAVVYGYNDVKALASNKDQSAEMLQKSGLVWPYAAIRSVEDEDTQEGGVTHARGGVFKTHFGEENTYCIYSAGGTMTVGAAGSAGGPSFEAVGSGVCIAMTGASGNVSEGGSLTISGGTFSSRLGNTIEMENGNMTVTAGTFKKNAADAADVDPDSTNNGSAISISGGTLNSSDTKDTSKPIQFHITGSHVNGIYAEGGEINIANAAFDFAEGENNQGVYNDGGTSRARWCEFSIPGDNNYGIHSTNGTTRASDCAITMTGEYAVGVYTTGGRALVEGGSINVGFAGGKRDKLLTSAAVSTEGGEIYLAGELTINSASLGVTVRKVEETEGSLEIADQEIKIENTTYKVVKGDVTINTPNATGIYINNGSLTNKGAVTVISSVGNEDGADKGWSWVDENGSAIQDFNKYNGVYVQGGSLVSNGTLNVTFTGVQNESHDSYDALNIRSYAVRVETAASGGKTEVSIAGGTISNSVGGGVYVGGGAVTLGVENGDGPTIGTAGVSFGDENTSAGGGNWKYYENKTGGHAVEVSGGDLFVYGGLYTAALGNGILVRDGNAWVLNGTFQGNDTKEYRDLYEGNLPAGPAAYYALKLLGGSVTTFGGTFGTYTADNTTHTAGGSSAFVTGADDQATDDQATANIYGGSFVVSGQSGFSVYQNVKLTFTPGEDETVNGQKLQGSDVKVSAATTAIAIENTKNENVSVTINGGTFQSMLDDSGQRDGIWDSNPYAKLTINEGEKQKTTISALAKHGINLVYAPAIENGVTITGGTITGKQDGIYYGSNGTAANGLLISGGTITGTNGSGLNLAGAPAASGAITISGGTITGYQDGILYSASTAIGGNGYGLTIKGGTITGTGTTDVHAHALKIDVAPQRHSILIEDGATLNGGRDAIFVSKSDGGDEAVSITGGLIQGGTVSSGGCALWFANNIDRDVFVISGGKFISYGGSAIGTNNPNICRLLRILPDGYLLTDQGGTTYDRNKYFRDINGISEITVRKS